MDDVVVESIDLGPPGEDPQVFRHGWQSWSATGWARLGHDVDPSTTEGSPWLSRAMHHGDPTPHTEGLRSEWVTVVRLADGITLIGADATDRHDTTISVRLDGGSVVADVIARTGGAAVEPHRMVVRSGDDAERLLRDWAAAVGIAMDARTTAPYRAGWCSWYHYFGDLGEDDIRSNLELATEWPFDLFQVDDGWQPAIGEWGRTRYHSDLAALAAEVAAAGFQAGIWLAPFLAAPGTVPDDWLAVHESGRPLVGMVNPAWGGDVHVLDTTRDDVLDHLTAVAADLVSAGWSYLKLDFTYAPAIPGTYDEPTWTGAQRVRRGLEAIRRGAGEETYLLGCGMPIGHGIGLVDGMRIGPDVAPSWEVPRKAWHPAGYTDTEPATVNALRNTRSRQFLHRRLWQNDPDCLMLRPTETDLTPEQRQAWADAVAGSGGLVMVSDDLSRCGAAEQEQLSRVLETGRRADDAALGSA